MGMTNEEVIQNLNVELEDVNLWLELYKRNGEVCEKREIRKAVLEAAIKALEQQPCEDAISRQAVLDIWHTTYSNVRIENEEIQYKKIAYELPSVTPQPFINKPCVSEGVCREDKIKVLDKIRAEIVELRSRQNVGVLECLDIIDKYKAESEE